VIRLTGRPISEFWKEHQQRGQSTNLSFVKAGLNLPREEIYRRIDERVDRMFQAGLVDEVRCLVEKWGSAAPAFRLIGYKEIIASLEGRISLDETVALIKQNTRRYAKRQMTWFRKDRTIGQFPGIFGK
jgi:tRNA dimethylallyltransferase